MTHLLDAALAFEVAGCSVVPARPDGSKAPAGSWKAHQKRRPGPAEVRAQLDGTSFDGFGVVCGAVSGNLELLEWEGRALAEGLYAQVEHLAAAAGLGDLWQRVTTGYRELTPGAGFHLLYRVDGPVAGNTKLAQRPATDAELALDPQDKVKVLIETRGEGGFVIVAPSAGRTHPSGSAWVVVEGGPTSIPTVTEAERDQLHLLARMLDQMPAPLVPDDPARAPRVRADGPLSPGDDYNDRATWSEILEPHGWARVYVHGGVTYWRRPGKSQGVSATTGRNDGDNLYVFSSSTVFEQETPYSKFGAYAVLEHGGDYSACAKALRQAGYGGERDNVVPLHELIGAPPATSATQSHPDGLAVALDVSPEQAAQEVSDAPEVHKRLRHGGAFILDAPDTVPTLWGTEDDVVWARGEALMLVGPPGVGKTTLTGQLLRGLLGLGGPVLGMKVEVTGSRVLYLAMDRPQQIARALRRAFTADERAVLDDRLRVWEGPPPVDIAKRPEILLGLAELAGADTVIVDSLKDAAIGLGEDEVAAGYNRARQGCLAAGVQMLELHHMVKRGANGGKPNELADVYGSTWLTAGAGSVVLLWGSAGDLIVELGHLKQPSGEVGPWRILHDHQAGTSTIFHEADPLTMARLAGERGITVKALACTIAESDDPDRNVVEKARRRLDGYVKKSLMTKREAPAGAVGAAAQATYHAVTHAVTDLIAEAPSHGITNQSRSDANTQVSAVTGSVTAVTRSVQSRTPPPFIGGRAQDPASSEHEEDPPGSFCRGCGLEVEAGQRWCEKCE